LSDRVVALCALDGFADALTVSATMRKRVDSLFALEVFFADGLALVCERTGLGLPFDRVYPTFLLVECAGRAGSASLLVDELASVLGECPQVQATAVAIDAAGRERLWAYRERHTEAINAAGIPHKLDVSLPFDQLVDFERAVRARLNEVVPHARVVCFGHLGDGNLHVNILGPPPDDFEVDDAVWALVAAMGGSISAEHGIGVAKRAALERSASPADLAAMRAINRALDPHGILNPGVLVAP
jgi:FAD/FMN-containing dehydrogenase